MKFQLLLDTCVWLDLAKNPADEPIISALEALVDSGKVALIVPNLVIDEFARNKDRVGVSSRQRLTQEFQKIRNVMLRYGDVITRESVIDSLDEVQHKLPILTDVVCGTINRVERLFEQSSQIEASDEVKLRAAHRALQKKAPFHKSKNSMADAVLIELYADLVKNEAPRIEGAFFITHNIHDFSNPIDNRQPHSDFEEFFDDVNSCYRLNLASALQDIDNEILQEYIAEYEWSDETRALSEILNHIDEFTDKIWFDRHSMRANSIAKGLIKVVPKENYKQNGSEIVDYIWNGALKAAEEVRQKYPDGLGPWSDYEWGMLNGKLSALRWVIGYEWDMLDT
ncbi:MAG: hypothetical protein CTY35_03940 [Methylotenera sp.]|nr:MAG: hypothetical protein CTY35_03940 [Methylotenera sp.]